jgi:hypothetical protein
MLAAMRNESGAALIVALMLLLGLAAMGAAAVMLSTTDLVVAGNDRQYRAALDVAEAGVAEGLHRLGLRPGTMVNVGGTDFDAAIRDMSDPPDINWRTRIFLTSPGSEPGSNGVEFSTPTIQAPGDYLEYSHASDPEQALTIRHKTLDFDGDGTQEVVLYDPGKVPPENPLTGTPVERITVEGQSGQARREVMVDAIRFPISPHVRAALLSDGPVSMRGNVTGCGHNHRTDTPVATALPVCSPAWDEIDGHLPGVMTTGDPISTDGSVDLLGAPTATDTDPGNNFLTLAQVLGVTQEELDIILEGADRTSLAGGGPWDGITVINGDVGITGGSGRGLLYVTGDMTISGNFDWRGLIYVEGDLRNTGNAWVLGAVVVGGSAGVDFAAGTPAILYSRDMLLEALNASMHYIVLSWKEL